MKNIEDAAEWSSFFHTRKNWRTRKGMGGTLYIWRYQDDPPPLVPFGSYDYNRYNNEISWHDMPHKVRKEWAWLYHFQKPMWGHEDG